MTLLALTFAQALENRLSDLDADPDRSYTIIVGEEPRGVVAHGLGWLEFDLDGQTMLVNTALLPTITVQVV